jgi:hypothetical protein
MNVDTYYKNNLTYKKKPKALLLLIKHISEINFPFAKIHNRKIENL